MPYFQASSHVTTPDVCVPGKGKRRGDAAQRGSKLSLSRAPAVSPLDARLARAHTQTHTPARARAHTFAPVTFPTDPSYFRCCWGWLCWCCCCWLPENERLLPLSLSLSPLLCLSLVACLPHPHSLPPVPALSPLSSQCLLPPPTLWNTPALVRAQNGRALF